MSPSRQAPASPLPGRPEKRRTIVEAAKRVFMRNGFSGTSVDAVAAEAGVSKQTIYNHFGDKDRLFTAVMDAVREAAEREATERFATDFVETGDFERDLRAAGRVMVRLMLSADIANLRRVVITEQERHPELIDRWASERPVHEEAMAREIERHTKLGLLDVEDFGLAAHQLVILVAQEAVLRSRYGLRRLSDDEIATIVDDGVDMWLRCYRRRGDTDTRP